MENTLLIVGQIKNKKTGLGKALNDLIDKLSYKNIKFIKLDITNNYNFLKIINVILFSDYTTFYFTPSGSRIGNIRDSIYILCAVLKKKKIVCHFHNSNFGRVVNRNKIIFKLNKLIYNKVDKIIILGKAQKNMFKGFNLIDDKFVIIPNGIDDDLFISEADLHKKFSNYKKNVVYFSNMIVDKGYLEVLQIANKLKENDEFHFYFSGKFFDKELEKNFLKNISMSKNITYYNGVYGDEKKFLLNNMHYFVLPTRYKDETLPISMLESIANGIYIIVSDIGVIKEYVNYDTTYLLNNKNNVEDIIFTLLKTKDNLKNLDFNLEYYKNKFSNYTIQEKIIKVICDVGDEK